MAGLYIHIPFCKQACHYCDFHFSTNPDHRPEVLKAIGRELQVQKDYLLGESLESIYFGGGTPSMLTTGEMESVFEKIYSHYTTDKPEITVEANPDDLTREKLSALKQFGINRLSIGIQSFDDSVLKFLNRAHDSADALRCFEEARNAGFDNISIDLIYAIPGQDQVTWEQNVERGLSLSPEHLSSYSLTIEEKTVFGKWQKNGRFNAVGEETAASQFESLMDRTKQAGYEHYEISNFCKPGLYSRHNSNYWKQRSYLGVGPSAHSYDQVSRQFNVSNNAVYTKAIQGGKIPFDREVLTKENKINEYIFTTLRTTWGCHMEKIKSDFGFDFHNSNREYLAKALEKNWVAIENDILTLTQSGKLFADKIAADLFVAER